MKMLMLVPIAFPILFGLILLTIDERRVKNLNALVGMAVVLNALFTWIPILWTSDIAWTPFQFTPALSFSLRVDGMAKLFAGMVAPLWVITTAYSFEYMKHDGHRKRFYGYYLMSFGVVIGVAFSANLFTLYLFYEYLSFVTLPLVMHSMTGEARYAAKKYLLYMVAGGALVFVAMLVLLRFGTSLDFVMGGILNPAAVLGNETLVLSLFLVAALGFGVKAAMIPAHGWLPKASVAPTPVTALLHAVAVVKAGVFSIARITYYSFGADFLKGSFAQTTLMVLSILTILMGSVWALRTPHFKRRLAYSTVSNLSYIVFAISLMSADGLAGGMMHLYAHALAKIVLFFCAGAVLHKTGVEYVPDLRGMGSRMPVTMGCYVAASLALIGVPPLGSFQSKWSIATAAFNTGTPLAYVGVGALLVSELLTLLYLFSPVVTAYFAEPKTKSRDEAGAWMLVPIVTVCVSFVFMSVFSGAIMNVIQNLIG